MEPYFNLMLRKSKIQRQVISFSFAQVVLKLKAVFQGRSLVVSENRTGPGKALTSPVCTEGSRVGNINASTGEL